LGGPELVNSFLYIGRTVTQQVADLSSRVKTAGAATLTKYLGKSRKPRAGSTPLITTSKFKNWLLNCVKEESEVVPLST
jgi:hypothetical protein